MRRTQAVRAIALAVSLLLLAGACAAEQAAPATGIAESEAVSAEESNNAGQPVDRGEAAAVGDEDATTATTTAYVGDPSDVDAKREAARTVSELSEAEETVGLADADVAPVAFDVPNDGEIEQAFGADRWTFDGQAGQLIAIDILDIDHGCRQDLTLVLESPSGRRGSVGWVGNGGCSGQGPFELDENGAYVIEFNGGDGGVIEENTGTYRFVPYWLTERDVAQPIFEQPNDGEITEMFGVDRWSFDATEGQLVTIDILNIDHDCRQDLYMTLEDPFQEREELGWVGNGGCQVQGPFEIQRTGTHVLEFWGGNGGVIEQRTGTYRFIPTFLTERDEEAAIVDTRYDGEISQVFGMDRWIFEATEGQTLTVDILGIDHGCRQDLYMTLEDPFQEREELGWIGNGGCQVQGPFEIQRTGTHVLEFGGGSGSVIEDNLGSYAFSFSLG